MIVAAPNSEEALNLNEIADPGVPASTISGVDKTIKAGIN
jgi:hypothetical protein